MVITGVNRQKLLSNTVILYKGQLIATNHVGVLTNIFQQNDDSHQL